METDDARRDRTGLSELIAALSRARTTAEVADALWWRRGAAAAGLALADPDPRLLAGGGGGGPGLDPLLVTEFAYAPGPLFFGSAAALLETYPILGTVGAPVPAGACAVLPLTGRDTPTGALVLTWERSRVFSRGDRGLLVALGGLCSAELARTWPRDRERDAVEDLRRRLRPDRLPDVPGAELAVRHRPADPDHGVGFYDVFGTEDGGWRLVAGGVAGRGVDVAVLTGLARQAFRSAGGGPAAALARLDGLVREFGDPDRRMSAVCVDLARSGPGFALTAGRAGHPAPLVLRATGAVVSLDVPGGPLGGRADPEPAELGVDLRPGDTLLLCAGGAERGGPVGDPRFTAVLAGGAGRPPEVLLDHVGRALSDRGGAAGTSFLALRVDGGPPDGVPRPRPNTAWS